MRIAYLLADPGIGIFGTKGASVHAQEMIRAFRALGHEVTVYATKRGDRAGQPETEHVPADLADLPVLTFPVPGVKGAAGRERHLAGVAGRMAECVATDGTEMIYERYSLFSAAGARAAAMMASRAVRPRLVVEVNAPLLTEQAEHRALHDAAGADRLTALLFGAADVLSCVSTPVAHWARERAGLAAGRDVRVIVTPNGVNTGRFRPAPARAETAAPGGPFTIGFVGTLKPWHGTELLLEAFAGAQGAQRGWRLEILGDGPLRERLTALAADRGVAGQVAFHGAVPPEQVPGMLGRLDVAVAPYPAGEHYFSPLKVYEYLAAGLPVVASAIGELPALVEGSGLLVPPGDVPALGSALERLAADPAARTRFAEHARRTAVTQHSWTSRARDVLHAAGAGGSDSPACPESSLTPTRQKVTFR